MSQHTYRKRLSGEPYAVNVGCHMSPTTHGFVASCEGIGSYAGITREGAIARVHAAIDNEIADRPEEA